MILARFSGFFDSTGSVLGSVGRCGAENRFVDIDFLWLSRWKAREVELNGEFPRKAKMEKMGIGMMGVSLGCVCEVSSRGRVDIPGAAGTGWSEHDFIQLFWLFRPDRLRSRLCGAENQSVD